MPFAPSRAVVVPTLTHRPSARFDHRSSRASRRPQAVTCTVINWRWPAGRYRICSGRVRAAVAASAGPDGVDGSKAAAIRTAAIPAYFARRSPRQTDPMERITTSASSRKGFTWLHTVQVRHWSSRNPAHQVSGELRIALGEGPPDHGGRRHSVARGRLGGGTLRPRAHPPGMQLEPHEYAVRPAVDVGMVRLEPGHLLVGDDPVERRDLVL